MYSCRLEIHTRDLELRVSSPRIAFVLPLQTLKEPLDPLLCILVS
jgi:hypothetical protein